MNRKIFTAAVVAAVFAVLALVAMPAQATSPTVAKAVTAAPPKGTIVNDPSGTILLSSNTPTTTATAAAAAPLAAAAPVVRCVVRLHGKGGDGAPTFTDSNGWKIIAPRGNAPGWGGYQWIYSNGLSFLQTFGVLNHAILAEGCTKTVVIGFSNGASEAAKLTCYGIGIPPGKPTGVGNASIIGYIVDDPVPDHGTDACYTHTTPQHVQVALYATGALGFATPGFDCIPVDWTCEGGNSIGIMQTARNLGVPVKPSANTTNTPYLYPPELALWLA